MLSRKTKTIWKRGASYLRRRYLVDPRVAPFGVMLHRIDQPDADRWLHDHPWRFVTIPLRGGYTEIRTDGLKTEERHIGCSPDGRGRRLSYLGPSTFHRIERAAPNTITLVVTGRRRRNWAYRVDWDDPVIAGAQEDWDEE